MSHPGYSPTARFTPAELVERLRIFVERTDHEFWPDDVSIRDPGAIDTTRVHGGRQLTDLYLLALAARHKGRLATFDQLIPTSAVPSARRANLVVVGTDVAQRPGQGAKT